MNIEEVNEKYKGESVVFSSYYKYSFTFEGTAADGNTISCSYGGDSSDIYRYDVSADVKEPFECVEAWSGVTIRSPTGEVLYEWNDW